GPSANSGTRIPIMKYAAPTHSKAFSGLPSPTCPFARIGPYRPQESAAPMAKITHTIDFFLPGFGVPIRTAILELFGWLLFAIGLFAFGLVGNEPLTNPLDRSLDFVLYLLSELFAVFFANHR